MDDQPGTEAPVSEQTFAVTLAAHAEMPVHSSEIAAILEHVARVVRVTQISEPADAAEGIRRVLERNGVTETVIRQALRWVEPSPDDEGVDAAAWTPAPEEEKGNG
jgi:hypothetical protein